MRSPMRGESSAKAELTDVQRRGDRGGGDNSTLQKSRFYFLNENLAPQAPPDFYRIELKGRPPQQPRYRPSALQEGQLARESPTLKTEESVLA